MNFATRQKLYEQIEQDRKTRVVAFVTSDRKGMETQIAADIIDSFVRVLDQIGPTEKISLLLHTNGGNTLAAWRVVNLLRTFCDKLEVIIPNKALSAGTMISIGADSIIMTKQAALGPIDPSVTTPLNPQVNIGGQVRHVPVSVEAIRGFLDAARDELNIKGEAALSQVLINLTGYIHPLVLGDIFRSRAQIRFLADKLISRQVSDSEKKARLIDFLCADSGSHDYTINRREANDLGLNVEKPSSELYAVLSSISESWIEELKIREPFTAQAVLQGARVDQPVSYTLVRGLIESTSGGCFGFVSEGTMTSISVNGQFGPQPAVNDERNYEGWRKIS